MKDGGGQCGVGKKGLIAQRGGGAGNGERGSLDSRKGGKGCHMHSGKQGRASTRTALNAFCARCTLLKYSWRRRCNSAGGEKGVVGPKREKRVRFYTPCEGLRPGGRAPLQHPSSLPPICPPATFPIQPITHPGPQNLRLQNRCLGSLDRRKRREGKKDRSKGGSIAVSRRFHLHPAFKT